MRGRTKIFLQMVLAMAVILALLFVPFYINHRNDAAPFADTFSLAFHETICESEHWELKAKDSAGEMPYLVYSGEGEVEGNPNICGSVYCTLRYYNGEKTFEKYCEINDPLTMSRHFMFGQKRWYIPRQYADYILHRACVQITWTQDGRMHQEWLISEGFDEEEARNAKTLAEEAELNFL